MFRRPCSSGLGYMWSCLSNPVRNILLCGSTLYTSPGLSVMFVSRTISDNLIHNTCVSYSYDFKYVIQSTCEKLNTSPRTFVSLLQMSISMYYIRIRVNFATPRYVFIFILRPYGLCLGVSTCILSLCLNISVYSSQTIYM